MPRRRTCIAAWGSRGCVGDTHGRRRAGQVSHVVRRKVKGRCCRHAGEMTGRHGEHRVVEIGIKVGASAPGRRTRLCTVSTAARSKVLSSQGTVPAVVGWRVGGCAALLGMGRRLAHMGGRRIDKGRRRGSRVRRWTSSLMRVRMRLGCCFGLRLCFPPGCLCKRALRAGSFRDVVKGALGVDGAALNATVIRRSVKTVDLESDTFDLARAASIARLGTFALGGLL